MGNKPLGVTNAETITEILKSFVSELDLHYLIVVASHTMVQQGSQVNVVVFRLGQDSWSHEHFLLSAIVMRLIL